MNNTLAIRLIGIHLNNVNLTDKDQEAWNFIREKLNKFHDIQDGELPKPKNVLIPENEFSRLINKIDDFVKKPENSAAKELARMSAETLRAYMPSELEKFYQLSKTEDINNGSMF
jgi:hypothetical protein